MQGGSASRIETCLSRIANTIASQTRREAVAKSCVEMESAAALDPDLPSLFNPGATLIHACTLFKLHDEWIIGSLSIKPKLVVK